MYFVVHCCIRGSVVGNGDGIFQQVSVIMLQWFEELIHLIPNSPDEPKRRNRRPCAETV